MKKKEKKNKKFKVIAVLAVIFFLGLGTLAMLNPYKYTEPTTNTNGTDVSVAHYSRFILMLKYNNTENIAVYTRNVTKQIITAETPMHGNITYVELGTYNINSEDQILFNIIWKDCVEENITDCLVEERVEFLILPNTEFIKLLIDFGVGITDEINVTKQKELNTSVS